MRPNSSKELFEEKTEKRHFKEKLLDQVYQENLKQRTLSEENFEDKKQASNRSVKKTNASFLCNAISTMHQCLT